MKKVITRIILILWMAVIFLFSAQNGTQSSGISRLVGYGIAENKSKLLHQDKEKEELNEQVEAMQLVIRKGAHMGEYALLAILFLWCIYASEKKPGRPWLWAWICSTLYAGTDEIHQVFVPGRDGRFLDVCIDSVGSLIGIALFLLCSWILKKHANKKKENRSLMRDSKA